MQIKVYIYIIIRILIHSTFYVLNFMLPACRPNFAEVVRTTKEGWAGLV
jgi:hypothetical protein